MRSPSHPSKSFLAIPIRFGKAVSQPEGLSRMQAALKGGFQTREAAWALAPLLGDLASRQRT